MKNIKASKNKKKFLSIVIPVCNSEKTIKKIYEKLLKVLENTLYEFEIIMVDDHSKDRSWSEIEFLTKKDNRVRGIKLEKNQQVISLIVPEEDTSIFTVSENGYGKRSKSADFRKTRRGAKGVIAMQISERNGQLIGAAQVNDDDELMLISDKGMLVRTRVSEVNVIGRNTQGVTVIRLKDSEKLISIAPISEEFIGDE